MATNPPRSIIDGRNTAGSGNDDDDAFDSYLQDFDPRGVVGDIPCPVPIVAGEDDELSPIEFTHDLFERLVAPMADAEHVLVDMYGNSHER